MTTDFPEKQKKKLYQKPTIKITPLRESDKNTFYQTAKDKEFYKYFPKETR